MTLLIICGLVFLLIFILGYNSLIGKRNQTDNAFSALDAMLKKRFDLIPISLPPPKTTLNNLVELRSKAINGNLTNTESIELDNQFSSAVRSFIVLAENYPELKASENYLQLQRALNETEEQISAARRNYNASVTDYNDSVQQFPSNIIASAFAFTPRPLLITPDFQRAAIDVNQLFK